MIAQPRARRLDGFSHDFAHRAGQLERALADHLRGFDEEDISARRSPGESDRDPRNRVVLRQFGFWGRMY